MRESGAVVRESGLRFFYFYFLFIFFLGGGVGGREGGWGKKERLPVWIALKREDGVIAEEISCQRSIPPPPLHPRKKARITYLPVHVQITPSP